MKNTFILFLFTLSITITHASAMGWFLSSQPSIWAPSKALSYLHNQDYQQLTAILDDHLITHQTALSWVEKSLYTGHVPLIYYWVRHWKKHLEKIQSNEYTRQTHVWAIVSMILATADVACMEHLKIPGTYPHVGLDLLRQNYVHRLQTFHPLINYKEALGFAYNHLEMIKNGVSNKLANLPSPAWVCACSSGKVSHWIYFNTIPAEISDAINHDTTAITFFAAIRAASFKQSIELYNACNNWQEFFAVAYQRPAPKFYDRNSQEVLSRISKSQEDPTALEIEKQVFEQFEQEARLSVDRENASNN